MRWVGEEGRGGWVRRWVRRGVCSEGETPPHIDLASIVQVVGYATMCGGVHVHALWEGMCNNCTRVYVYV